MTTKPMIECRGHNGIRRPLRAARLECCQQVLARRRGTKHIFLAEAGDWLERQDQILRLAPNGMKPDVGNSKAVI